MLSNDNIASLARGQTPQDIPVLTRNLESNGWQQEWLYHNGWNRADDVPPALDSPYTVIRKVEIHDVYDLKSRWWKATDGIRESTWPGVYGRSRLPGRNDYFQLPDWDCYSLSGKSATIEWSSDSHEKTDPHVFHYWRVGRAGNTQGDCQSVSDTCR